MHVNIQKYLWKRFNFFTSLHFSFPCASFKITSCAIDSNFRLPPTFFFLCLFFSFFFWVSRRSSKPKRFILYALLHLIFFYSSYFIHSICIFHFCLNWTWNEHLCFYSDLFPWRKCEVKEDIKRNKKNWWKEIYSKQTNK